VKCATHPDRTALGYCGRCGKALCKECLVRLSTGNYCDTCANAPDRAPARVRRGIPWWVVGLILLAVLIVFRTLIH
jgi:B-box zinc finger